MLSIGLMRGGWRSDGGGVLLRLFLVAAVSAPLVAAATGQRLATPFGLSLTLLAITLAIVGIAYTGWRVRQSPTRGLVRVGVDVVVLATLAAAFALITDRASNAFYTQEVLADAMAVLLMVHLAGAALRAVGLSRQRWPRLTMLRGDGSPAVPRRSEPASMQFADGLTAAMAVLVACFWGLAAIGFHEGAAILLLLAGMFGTIAIIARLPGAFINERVLFQDWRRTRKARRGGGAATLHEEPHVRSS